ncbi:hypothetical protein DTO063F5_2409 [Paecilomyces variotii]|nr:hypothetical protein DTO063F5_2409 [Paecilomyces variotii]
MDLDRREIEIPPELDGFSVLFPLPYRLALIVVAGFWGWGVNLHYLSKLKIDVPALIRYPARQTPNQKPHHVSVYHLATLLTIPLGASLLLFWMLTHGSIERVKSLEWFPQIYVIIFLIILILPVRRLSRSGRYRFLMTLKRISIGGLALPQDGKFGDILLADALTSYAKILGDLYVNFCMLFTGGMSATGKPNRACGGEFVVPIIVAVPSLIRFRQCLIEFVRVQKQRDRGDGWGGQHLANALKYASAFPVIALTALQRNYNPFVVGQISEVQLYHMWIFFACINSFYSFYWDVTKDWDLTLFTEARSDPQQPFALRRKRCFPTTKMYYGAIIIDFFLRFTWTSKLSSKFDHINETEFGLFMLMFLEVARRWMWIFFRVETEWVRSIRGPAPDDILLGEFNRKLDED